MSELKFKHKLEYWLTQFLTGIFRLLPLPFATSLGMSIGGFAYKVFRIRRKVTLENLRTAFPEKNPSELEIIAYKSYRHWGGVGAEYARLTKFTRKECDKYITLEGREVIDKCIAGGKGGLVISGHFGNWEIIGAAASILGYGVTYIVASQSNKLIDKMMDDVRLHHGIEIWKRHQAPRGVLKSIRNNRCIAIMIDQDARKDSIFVDFFGKPAATHRGPAVFHLKTGSPFVISSCIRQKGAHYVIKFEECNLPDFSGSREEINEKIMAFLTNKLENQVRKNPEQYFWMHKRWKTRPK